MALAVAEKGSDALALADSLAVAAGGSEKGDVDTGSLYDALTANDPTAVASSVAETVNGRAIAISEANAEAFTAIE